MRTPNPQSEIRNPKSADPIGFGGGDVNLYGYVGNGPLNGTDPSGLIDLGREGIPAGRSPETVLEYLDGLDGTINAVESVAGDPIIGVAPIPIYNEGIRLQPITALGVARGFVDMFRVGKGIGAAIFCDDIDGWERAVFVLQDVTRASALFATLAGPVAGKGGGGPSKPRTRFLVAEDGTTFDLNPTLDRIQSGVSFPHRNDGSVFRNIEGNLPAKSVGFYREYVYPTPGSARPGRMRIVIGQDGEAWFTSDHYSTFTKIR